MKGATKIHNLNFRVALTIVLALGGFIFPILFVFALLVGWSLAQDFRNPPQEVDAWFTRRWTTTADDPDWKAYFLPVCESPAETAFLEAMIAAYTLTPDKGALRAGDLSLELQVKVPPYRADFLINGCLMVEIDGATYHSSPEAIKRDRERDEFMQARGYSVLRIPASVVFSNPSEAVNRVRSFVSKKHSIVPKAETAQPARPERSISLQEILSTVNAGVTKINRDIDKQVAIQIHTKGHRDRFYAESLAIEKAIELAESEIRVQHYMSQSDKHRELYLEAYEELRDILEDNAQNSDGNKAANIGGCITIPPLPKNYAHPDPWINEAISNACQSIAEERNIFFEEVRSKLSNDERLRTLVKTKLNELGCTALWQHIF